MNENRKKKTKKKADFLQLFARAIESVPLALLERWASVS